MIKLIFRRILAVIMFFMTLASIIVFGKSLHEFEGDGAAQLVFIMIIITELFCTVMLWREPKTDSACDSYGPFDWL